MLGFKELHKVTNHPGHILNHHGDLMPTALIPFCSLGKTSKII